MHRGYGVHLGVRKDYVDLTSPEKISQNIPIYLLTSTRYISDDIHMNTKLLVSFAAEDLETIDQVVEKYGLPSRASAVRLAIRRMSGERGKVDDDGRGGSGVRVAGERLDEGVGVGVPADGIQGTGAVDEGERGGGVEVGGAAAAGKVDPRVAALLGSLGPKLRLKPAAEVVPLEVESEDAVPWEPAAEVVPEGMVYLGYSEDSVESDR